jgi:formylglycine-generating enzyme required for sulfatase activity
MKSHLFATVFAIVVLIGCEGKDYKNKPTDTAFYIEDDVPIEMVFVEGGTFTMGCTDEQGDDCRSNPKTFMNIHNVTVGDFYVGKYEVTHKQWEHIMGRDKNPSLFYFMGDNFPVEHVSWYDVQEFIKKLNKQTGQRYRLPTEAEWEYAARGGNKSKRYKYSGSNNIDDVAMFLDRNGITNSVDSMLPNELGIYGMSGNVQEWVNDRYGAYGKKAQTNPKGPLAAYKWGYFRVIRGGCWDCEASHCNIASRDFESPHYDNYDLGFRLALSP